MTNSTHTVEETVAVIQADRDAALAYGLDVPRRYANDLREGYHDDNELVQAFARHRLASHSTPAGEDVERVAQGELVERAVRAAYDDWPIRAVSPALADQFGLAIGDPIPFDALEKAGGNHDGLRRIVRAAIASLPPSTHDELVEALAGCEGLESGPNGSGGMRVVAHFPVGSEHALFDLLNAALTKMGEKL